MNANYSSTTDLHCDVGVQTVWATKAILASHPIEVFAEEGNCVGVRVA